MELLLGLDPGGVGDGVASRYTTSHRDLAKRANVSPTSVLNLEASRVEAQRRTIRKLAEALGVKPGELVEA